jgi:hypothetical protein
MKQNAAPFCALESTVPSVIPAFAAAADGQNDFILSIAIEFSHFSTICNSLSHNDLRHHPARTPKQNAINPER